MGVGGGVSMACGRTRCSGTTGRNKAEDFNKFLGRRVDAFPRFVFGARHFFRRSLVLTAELYVLLPFFSSFMAFNHSWIILAYAVFFSLSHDCFPFFALYDVYMIEYIYKMQTLVQI